MLSYFGSVDLKTFHAETVAQRATSERGKEAAELVGNGRAIGVQVDDGIGWTFQVSKGVIDIKEGVSTAPLLLRTDTRAWSDLITEAWSIIGLVLQGRVVIERGNFNHVVKWEAALQALYNDRPIWFPRSETFNQEYVFSLNDDAEIMQNALQELGFIRIQNVFTHEEIKQMGSEVNRRREAASPDDKRSWWATDMHGNERCCRVTYLNHGSELFASLPYDKRLLKLAKLSEEKLVPTPEHGDGVSAVIKVPDVVEGLSDLPWHRDCGMGGHPLLCPGLNIGIQLDSATAKTGQLKFLQGSNTYGGGANYASDSPLATPVDTNAGDVTIHFGHTLHVAPPPTGASNYRRTVYVSFHVSDYQEVLPEGQGYNDVLFSHGDGRVRTPQERLGNS
ncbi:MAG: phytanoyl-CoA dioxygenase family protein [Acidimicrobiales bacterium]|nr:phytanoyl-CoA dioxygenase family protein [Acidimicrobiales bacterium]MDG1846134.1 phytanoyl-CoA dioxygenase family protein [Acidimicrobiales bacterium]